MKNIDNKKKMPTNYQFKLMKLENLLRKKENLQIGKKLQVAIVDQRFKKNLKDQKNKMKMIMIRKVYNPKWILLLNENKKIAFKY